MKAQSSLEFIFFISILALILSIFLWSNASIQERFVEVKTVNEAKKTCDSIAFEINTAVRAGNGYSRKFYVEKDFFGAPDFNILVVNYTVIIDWDKGAASCRILTKNISGSINKGWNLVQNSDGEIHVSQA